MGGNWFCWIVETHSAFEMFRVFAGTWSVTALSCLVGRGTHAGGETEVHPILHQCTGQKRWRPVGLSYFPGEGFLLAKNVWSAINKSQNFLLVQARCIKIPWAISHSTLTWFHAKIHDSHRMVRALKFHYWMIASPENYTETATCTGRIYMDL